MTPCLGRGRGKEGSRGGEGLERTAKSIVCWSRICYGLGLIGGGELTPARGSLPDTGLGVEKMVLGVVLGMVLMGGGIKGVLVIVLVAVAVSGEGLNC